MSPWSHVAEDARRYHRPLLGGIELVRSAVLADIEARAALPPDARPVVGSDWARLYHALLTACAAAVQAGASVTTRRELMASVFEARWMMGRGAEEAKERMRRWAEVDGLSPETSEEASRQVDERVAMGTWGVGEERA